MLEPNASLFFSASDTSLADSPEADRVPDREGDRMVVVGSFPFRAVGLTQTVFLIGGTRFVS